MKKYFYPSLYSIFSVILLSISFSTQAQSDYEIFTYGNQNTLGSARSIGLGGASASLGGDYTGVVNNPATLGVYRTKQFGFTMAVDFDNAEVAIQNKSFEDGRTWFSFNQAYYVSSNAYGQDRKNVSSWTWGIGMNRIANYNRKVVYERENTENSYIDLVADSWNTGGDSAGWYAWDVGLTDEVSGALVPSFEQNGNSLNQRQSIEYSGSLNEINLSVAYNHENRIMLGGGLGIPTGAQKRVHTYTEKDRTQSITNLNDFTYLEESRTTIVGINAKLGILYQPEAHVRIGAFYQSPTICQMEDTFYYNFTSDVEGYANLPAGAQSYDFIGENPYGLRISSNYGVSATYLFGPNGLITFDYIRQNPQNFKVNLNDYYYQVEDEINGSIKGSFQGINTFKLGAEGRINKFYIRAGANYTTAPYKSLSSYGGESMGFALGLGFRTTRLAFDLFYSNQTIKYSDEPYNAGLSDGVAKVDDHIHRIGLGIGIR